MPSIFERIQVSRQGLPVSPFRFIQRLQLDFLLFCEEKASTDFFYSISKGARRGALKSLTLKAFCRKPALREERPLSLSLPKGLLAYYRAQLCALLHQHDNDFMRVQRSLIVEKSAVACMQSSFPSAYAFDLGIEEIHEALGGELWLQDPVQLDYKLWRKDGEQLVVREDDGLGNGPVQTKRGRL